MSRLGLLNGVAVLLIVALPAAGLEPAEVAVVANANVPQSVELATHYADVRNIPAENIFLVRTATGYGVSRAHYNKQILEPIRRYLAERNSPTPIRCICLMWGVPVRVENVEQIGAKGLAELYAAEADRARQRLALDREYIARIGRRFDEPQVNNLEPLAKVFGPPAPRPPKNVPNLAKLQETVAFEWAQAVELAGKAADSNRRIAEQQLLAMQLELGGLSGLIAFVDQNHPSILPDAGAYASHLELANAKLAELGADATEQSLAEARQVLQWMQRADGIVAVATYAAQQHARLKPSRSTTSDASVDSELAMISFPKYPIKDFVPNFLHFSADGRVTPGLPPMIMTCRIDGPSAKDARRIIDDSIFVEQRGLTGVAYVDAGLPPRFQNKAGDYGPFDERLKETARMLRQTSLKTVLDVDPTVFRPNTCPNAALYVGWYSLRSYVPAFEFARGAVAYHVASYEAMNLRNPDTNEWCAKLIQNGVAATVGATNEPTLGAFPHPQGFFLMLLTGQYTVAECYWRNNPFASWHMTLIADPLYNPFKVNHPIPPEGVVSPLKPPENWAAGYQPPENFIKPVGPTTTEPAEPVRPLPPEDQIPDSPVLPDQPDEAEAPESPFDIDAEEPPTQPASQPTTQPAG